MVIIIPKMRRFQVARQDGTKLETINQIPMIPFSHAFHIAHPSFNLYSSPVSEMDT